jgi:hypothetical protein
MLDSPGASLLYSCKISLKPPPELQLFSYFFHLWKEVEKSPPCTYFVLPLLIFYPIFKYKDLKNEPDIEE